jgi:hypothetical protein
MVRERQYYHEEIDGRMRRRSHLVNRPWDATDQSAYNDRMSHWKASLAKYREQRGQLWSVILGSVTSEVLTKIQMDYEYATALEDYQTLTLLEIIQRVVHGFDPNDRVALATDLHTFLQTQNGRDIDLDKFLTQWQQKLDDVRLYDEDYGDDKAIPILLSAINRKRYRQTLNNYDQYGLPDDLATIKHDLLTFERHEYAAEPSDSHVAMVTHSADDLVNLKPSSAVFGQSICPTCLQDKSVHAGAFCPNKDAQCSNPDCKRKGHVLMRCHKLFPWLKRSNQSSNSSSHKQSQRKKQPRKKNSQSSY